MDLSLRKKKGGALTFVVEMIGEQQQVSNYPANIERSDLPQTPPSNGTGQPGENTGVF
jgi:hypothetical protein